MYVLYLQSKHIKHVFVNSKFQLVTQKFQIKIAISKGKLSQIFTILVRPVSQNKAPINFFASHSSLTMLKFPNLKFEGLSESWNFYLYLLMKTET